MVCSPKDPFARISLEFLGILLICGGLSSLWAADPFAAKIVPFLKTYCIECHNSTSAEAQLNFERYDSARKAADDFRQWDHVLTFVQRDEMPPRTAQQQPSTEARADFLQAVRTMLHDESLRQAGDPGVVLPRRLSNAELDYAIRDLTGIDIRPTRSFPVDPAGGEGFTNTGEALTISTSLFSKLYAAAQIVADHALLTTAGIEFAPYPVATFADRAKLCEQAILQFYDQHKVVYEDCLTACWEYKFRPTFQRKMSIEDWANLRGLSSKYLHLLHSLLNGDPAADGLFITCLRHRWNALPAPANEGSPVATAELKAAVKSLADEIRMLSKRLCPKETEPIIANASNAPILHLERRRKTASERDLFDPKSSRMVARLHCEIRNLNQSETVKINLSVSGFDESSPVAEGFVLLKSMNFSIARSDSYSPNDEKRNIPLRKVLMENSLEQFDRLKFGIHPQGVPIDPAVCVLAVPGSLEFEVPAKALGESKQTNLYVDVELDAAHTKSGLAKVSLEGSNDRSILLIDPENPSNRDLVHSGEMFCRVFPNRFYYVDDPRGLSAGFHLIEGFFRDDQPLCNSVLNAEENRELDRLWRELEFITGITEKMLRGFVFFERSERNFLKHADFDAFKEEDPKLVDVDTLNRFERAYLAHSGVKAADESLESNPIHIFFEQIRNGLALRREQVQQARPIYLHNLGEFAHRAYRRPLTAGELDDLRTFFHQVADDKDQGLEQAVRASLVRLLVSPHFCCRIDTAPGGNAILPLSDVALASRLSFFLWSSIPDAELLAVAESNRLQDEATLLEQTRRMLKDSRVTDFAREFFGQWLGYRDFVEQESVDRAVFKEFDDSLKQAMFEEPTRLAAHLIQQNRPVTELLIGDLTFVDQRLARHYGIPFQGNDSGWELVEGLRGRGRGGILGMAVFLTKNSQPQRTSPVKRGFWVVHKVLGEHIPAPPADVVALPAKETDTNGKTIRELLAMHVEADKCARCHQRFDAVGLSMEGFDRIGGARNQDLAGRPIDNLVRLADGTETRGVAEFAQRLVHYRRTDFVLTLCRKLLGYALGRSLQLSDNLLLVEMQAKLDRNGDCFVPLFETIVRSPQFRNQRSRNFKVSDYRSLNQGVSR